MVNVKNSRTTVVLAALAIVITSVGVQWWRVSRDTATEATSPGPTPVSAQAVLPTASPESMTLPSDVADRLGELGVRVGLPKPADHPATSAEAAEAAAHEFVANQYHGTAYLLRVTTLNTGEKIDPSNPDSKIRPTFDDTLCWVVVFRGQMPSDMGGPAHRDSPTPEPSPSGPTWVDATGVVYVDAMTGKAAFADFF